LVTSINLKMKPKNLMTDRKNPWRNPEEKNEDLTRSTYSFKSKYLLTNENNES
jgi:hypothetical protein